MSAMSPEERAKELFDKLTWLDSDMARRIGDNGLALIASAIREAENEAYTRAAAEAVMAAANQRRKSGDAISRHFNEGAASGLDGFAAGLLSLRHPTVEK